MTATDPKFRFHVPIDAAFEKAGPDGKSRRMISGFISTEDVDRQGETVLQDGLSVKPFLERGWLNDNHSKSTAGAIGYPTTIRKGVTKGGKKGTYMEGYLLQGDPVADSIWAKHHALEKAGFPRRLGFSVEGTIQHRTGQDKKTISKAKVLHVAVTHCPVNPQAELEVLHKALTAGGAIDRPAGGPAQGDSFPLRTENLEGREVVTDTPRKKKKKKKRLNKSEAIQFLIRQGYGRVMAERIWQHASTSEELGL